MCIFSSIYDNLGKSIIRPSAKSLVTLLGITRNEKLGPCSTINTKILDSFTKKIFERSLGLLCTPHLSACNKSGRAEKIFVKK